MLRDLPSELKMNIINYTPYRFGNTVAATVAIDDAVLLEELKDLDPNFSLASLLAIYEEQSDFSMDNLLHVIDEKKRIMKDAPNVVKLYNIIGPIFDIEVIHVEGEEYHLRFTVRDLKDKPSTIDQLRDLFGPEIIRNVVNHPYYPLEFSFYGDILKDIVSWDRLIGSESLFDGHIGEKYASIHFMQ